MSQEQKRAIDPQVAAKVMETVDELERMIAGGGEGEDETTRPGGDPRERAFLMALGPLEDEAAAKAALLEELIDLVLPEVKRVAKPLRAYDKVSKPERVQELEKLFGTLAAKARGTSWLDEPALPLCGGKVPTDAVGATPQDSGVILGHELFLLASGKLVIVDSVGTWSVQDKRLVADTTIVHARQVDLGEVVREFNLSLLLLTLRNLLHPRTASPAGEPSPELTERQDRFDALVADLSKVVAAHVVRLRRVGDSPA
jgi:hypothetical protein